MDEIDKYIADFKRQNELEDYIKRDIYPPSIKQIQLTNTTFYKKMKREQKQANNTSILNNYHHESCESFISEITTKLSDCLQQLSQIHIDECPICIEPLGDVDYFMPICGHKICRSCALENLHKNNVSGHLCGICRTRIF